MLEEISQSPHRQRQVVANFLVIQPDDKWQTIFGM